MTRRMVGGWTLLLLAAATLVGPADAAPGKRVAVIPAHVFTGAPGSQAVLMNALREDLRRNGFEPIAEEAVNRALEQKKLNVKLPLSTVSLTEVLSATGADYVIYPRILAVGAVPGTLSTSATILVNSLAPDSKSFLHTMQVGQRFLSTTPRAGDAVMTPPSAAEAAGRLLDGFYRKVHSRK